MAEFIGSNTIILGTPGRAIEGGLQQIETSYGPIAGMGQTGADTAVIPAESFRLGLRHTPGEIALPGTVTAKQLVGSIGFLRVRLSDGREVDVETHSGSPEAQSLSSGSPVTLGIDPASVTLIQQ